MIYCIFTDTINWGILRIYCQLQMEYKELNKQFWCQHLWAMGYIASGCGNVMDEFIALYIQNLDIEENMKGDTF